MILNSTILRDGAEDVTHLSRTVRLKRPEHEESLEEDAADVDAAEVVVAGSDGGLDGLAEGAAEHRVHLYHTHRMSYSAL